MNTVHCSREVRSNLSFERDAAKARRPSTLRWAYKNMKMAFFSVLLIFFSPPLFSQELIYGKINEYGIYSAVNKKEYIYAPDTAAGHSTLGKFEIKNATDKIPVIMGLSFGFKWSVYGFQDDQTVEITHLLEHPPIKKPDGTLTKISREKFFYRPVKGKIEHTEGYSFTENFELVEGEYKFSVIYKGNVIVTKSFVASKSLDH